MSDAQRNEIIREALAARTREEIERALRRIEEWLAEHPRDTRVMSAAEQLYMMRSALEILDSVANRNG